MSLDDVQAKYDTIKTKNAEITTLETDKQTYMATNKVEFEAAIATVSTHRTAVANYDSQIEVRKHEIEILVGEIEQIFKDMVKALRGVIEE